MSDLSRPNFVMATLGWFDLTCWTMSALGAYWFGDGCGLNTVGGLKRFAFGMDACCEEMNVDDIIFEPLAVNRSVWVWVCPGS